MTIKGTFYHSYFSWSEATLRKVYLTYEYRYVTCNIYLKRKKVFLAWYVIHNKATKKTLHALYSLVLWREESILSQEWQEGMKIIKKEGKKAKLGGKTCKNKQWK